MVKNSKIKKSTRRDDAKAQPSKHRVTSKNFDKEVTIVEPKPSFMDLVNSKFDNSSSQINLSSHKIIDQLQDILDTNQEVESVLFSFMSDEDIENYAVCEITDPKIDIGPGTVYDPLMGPGGPGSSTDICRTCKSNWKDCPGHFGVIKLAIRLPHPMRSKSILNYLKICCMNCNRLAITEQHIKLNKISGSGDKKFQKIVDFMEKQEICMNCNKTLPDFIFEDEKYYFYYKKQNQRWPLSFSKIENIFSNIPDADIELMGLNPKYVHPILLTIKNLPVIPPCVRSFVVGDSGVSHDDLTHKYADIVKKNQALDALLKDPKSDEKEKQIQDCVDSLVYHVKTLMDNSKGKAKNVGGKRPIKCIKKRLSGKSGLIRCNIQGKRIDYCGRTVITPEAMGEVDQLVIPTAIAEKLTIPIRVNATNIHECQRLLEEGKVVNLTVDGKQKSYKWFCFSPGFKLLHTDKVIRTLEDGTKSEIQVGAYEALSGNQLELQEGDSVIRDSVEIKDWSISRKKTYNLKIGDLIERQVQDGDWTLFNRQPTLWKGSMRAKQIKVLPGKTFRFNLASTQAFNADFDKQTLSKTGGLKRL